MSTEVLIVLIILGAILVICGFYFGLQAIFEMIAERDMKRPIDRSDRIGEC